MYEIPVTMRFVPNTGAFAKIPDTAIKLKQYGWTNVSFDFPRPAVLPIQTVQEIIVTFNIDGKPGATAAEASGDVEYALTNASLRSIVIGRIAAKLASIPADAARKAGEAAGAAVAGGVKGAGIGISAAAVVTGLVAIAVVVGVAVFAFKAKVGPVG